MHLTEHSGCVLSTLGTSAADAVIQQGVIIVHDPTQKILVYEKSGTYSLPTQELVKFAESLQDPLAFAREETGLDLRRSVLHKRERYYFQPSYYANDTEPMFSPNPRLRLSEVKTMSPFKVTYHFTRRDNETRWPDPRQVITFWYVGCVEVDDARVVVHLKDGRRARLVTILDLLDDITLRPSNDVSGMVEAMLSFYRLWGENRKIV